MAGGDDDLMAETRLRLLGRFQVRRDGEEFEARPGQVTALPSGHDAWVVGDEPVIVVDWWGASNYAKG